MGIKIIGKPFKEKREFVCLREVLVYPTNQGNLTSGEIAEKENVARQTVINKICRGLYSLERKKPGRHKIIKESKIDKDLLIKIKLGSWEQEQLNK